MDARSKTSSASPNWKYCEKIVKYALLATLIACNIPSSDEIIADTTDACHKIVEASIPKIVAQTTEATLLACMALVQSVDDAPLLTANNILFNLGCDQLDLLTWDCSHSKICLTTEEIMEEE